MLAKYFIGINIFKIHYLNKKYQKCNYVKSSKFLVLAFKDLMLAVITPAHTFQFNKFCLPFHSLLVLVNV